MENPRNSPNAPPVALTKSSSPTNTIFRLHFNVQSLILDVYEKVPRGHSFIGVASGINFPAFPLEFDIIFDPWFTVMIFNIGAIFSFIVPPMTS